MMVSPSESPAFRAMGHSTWKVENWGVDALWAARGRFWGVQRKALKDLVASVEDGRLAKERLQWPSVSGMVWIIVETGERGGAAPREMPNGQIVSLGTYGRAWTGPALRSLTFSLMVEDRVGIVWTKDEAETLERVVELVAWTRKAKHVGGVGRESCPVDVFGQRDSRAYGIHLLTSLPGVGVEMAGRVYDHFGRLPMQMTVGLDELMEVDGVGKVRAKQMLEVFGGQG